MHRKVLGVGRSVVKGEGKLLDILGDEKYALRACFKNNNNNEYASIIAKNDLP